MSGGENMKRDDLKYRKESYSFCHQMRGKLCADPSYVLSIKAIDDWHADLKKRGFQEKDIKARVSIAERLFNQVHSKLDVDFEHIRRYISFR
jgi:hypothetical protein